MVLVFEMVFGSVFKIYFAEVVGFSGSISLHLLDAGTSSLSI